MGINANLVYMHYSTPFLSFATAYTTPTSYTGVSVISIKGNPRCGCDIAVNYTLPNKPGYTIEAGWYYVNAKFSRTHS